MVDGEGVSDAGAVIRIVPETSQNDHVGVGIRLLCSFLHLDAKR